MSRPLAYLLTWTTYGSWLPGDARGWVGKYRPGIQAPDPERMAAARESLKGEPTLLSLEQRAIVETAIRAHCRIKGWTLHAVNVRTNHVHVVVTADGVPPELVVQQFKAWASRHLGKQRLWTRHGSTKWINDESYLANAIRYVIEGQ